MSESTNPRPVLEVIDLVVHFRRRARRNVVRAVDGVSFDVARGEILALVGESGCGKSTIAMAVARLVAPTSGRIVIDGTDVTSVGGRALRAIRRRVQMIFQDPFGSLDARQTVFETVAEPIRIHRLARDPEDRRRRVMAALDQANLRPPERLAQRYPHELSGGQRQRVAIAAAMAVGPELVVADEPVSMLDVSARAGVLRLMMEGRDRLGVSYLFITHDLATAWVVADRIAVVYLGRIVEIGPSPELVAHPAHPYTSALLAVAGGEEHDGPVLPGEAPSAAAVPSGCRFHPRCPRYVLAGEPAICRDENPTLHIRGAGTGPAHRVACHLAQQDPMEEAK